MNFTCSSYKPPSEQSTVYSSGTLYVEGTPFKPVSASLYLNHKKAYCNVIQDFKHSSYERYLQKKKTN